MLNALFPVPVHFCKIRLTITSDIMAKKERGNEMDREWNKHEMKEKMAKLMHILEAVESGVLLEDECKEMGYNTKRVETIFRAIGRLQHGLEKEDLISPDDAVFTDTDFRQKAVIRCQSILLTEIGSAAWNTKYPDVMPCGLSSRSINALRRESCITFYDLLGFSDGQLRRLRNFGPKCMDEIKGAVNDIAHRMFGMSAEDLADVVYSIPKDAEIETIKKACMGISIWNIELETTAKNGIARDMFMRGVCGERVSLYDLMNPDSSLFKRQIPGVGKERLHDAQKVINGFVLKRFGMSIGSLSKLLYHE